MMFRTVTLAILAVTLAGWTPSRDPVFQVAQNVEDSGKAAKPVDPADREMMVGRFNLEKRNYIGALNRFKIVIQQYSTSPYVEEAWARISETFLALGVSSEAQCAVAMLQRKFPDSPWLHQALDTLKSAGLEPAEDKRCSISRGGVETLL
jgi:hypothetical protein